MASSINGYIAAEKEDNSYFIMQGDGVDKYQSNVTNFDAVSMGRKIYELGFQYDLESGQLVYANMNHYIFSNSLKIYNLSECINIEKPSIDRIREIKENYITEI